MYALLRKGTKRRATIFGNLSRKFIESNRVQLGTSSIEYEKSNDGARMDSNEMLQSHAFRRSINFSRTWRPWENRHNRHDRPPQVRPESRFYVRRSVAYGLEFRTSCPPNERQGSGQIKNNQLIRRAREARSKRSTHAVRIPVRPVSRRRHLSWGKKEP